MHMVIDPPHTHTFNIFREPWVTNKSQVLETLKQNAAPPQPFPLQRQYVQQILAARESADDPGNPEGETVEPKPEAAEPAKTNRKKSAKPKQTNEGEPSVVKNSNWQYSKVRTLFIKTQRDSGLGFEDAKNRWDESLEKAKFLSEVSIPELKRRKFLPKGEHSVNPWLEKLREFANR